MIKLSQAKKGEVVWNKEFGIGHVDGFSENSCKETTVLVRFAAYKAGEPLSIHPNNLILQSERE